MNKKNKWIDESIDDRADEWMISDGLGWYIGTEQREHN